VFKKMVKYETSVAVGAFQGPKLDNGGSLYGLADK
jgi:hypothetical protein